MNSFAKTAALFKQKRLFLCFKHVDVFRKRQIFLRIF